MLEGQKCRGGDKRGDPPSLSESEPHQGEQDLIHSWGSSWPPPAALSTDPHLSAFGTKAVGWEVEAQLEK